MAQAPKDAACRKDQCPDKSRHRCQCTFTARLRRPSLQQAAELVNRGSEAFCHSMANGSWLSDNIGTQRGEETTMGAIVAMFGCEIVPHGRIKTTFF